MTAVQEPNAPAGARPREVRVVAHSMLFYWWPVWAVGFVMAGLTWLDGHRLAIVPARPPREDAAARISSRPDGSRLPLP